MFENEELVVIQQALHSLKQDETLAKIYKEDIKKIQNKIEKHLADERKKRDFLKRRDEICLQK